MNFEIFSTSQNFLFFFSTSSSIKTNCSQDIDMRILAASTTPLAAVTVGEDIRTKSPPTLTISTIASPDHQPCQANVVTALLPPVPPLTSSPVMSLLNKAQNNATKQSMFSDLGSSSDTTPGTGLFINDSLDYSQYLKDSNIDLDKTDLEDFTGNCCQH